MKTKESHKSGHFLNSLLKWHQLEEATSTRRIFSLRRIIHEDRYVNKSEVTKLQKYDLCVLLYAFKNLNIK